MRSERAHIFLGKPTGWEYAAPLPQGWSHNLIGASGLAVAALNCIRWFAPVGELAKQVLVRAQRNKVTAHNAGWPSQFRFAVNNNLAVNRRGGRRGCSGNSSQPGHSIFVGMSCECGEDRNRGAG